jgi:hypothetical protein
VKSPTPTLIHLVKERALWNLPPKGVWITPWITEMNWNWMEKDFASLRNARDLVVGRLADLVPGPDRVAALDPEAGPGRVAAPGLAAAPGPRTGPSLAIVLNPEAGPNPRTEATPRKTGALGTRKGPSLAIEASHVTDPSLAIDPGPDHVTVQTPNRSLDRDLALNPEMIKKHHIKKKTVKTKQEIIAGARRFLKRNPTC